MLLQASPDSLSLVAMNSSILELSQQLGKALLARGAKVTTAESCTGGGVAYAITATAGSSDWFEAGFVTYANAVKHRELGVQLDTLAQQGAVSEEVVLQMAAGALVRAQAHLAVSISGIAGPDGGTEEKPVGTVWFAWADSSGRRVTECCHFAGDRAAIREQSVIKALRGLLELVSE